VLEKSWFTTFTLLKRKGKVRWFATDTEIQRVGVQSFGLITFCRIF